MKVQKGAHANASHRRGAGLRIRSMRDELLLAKAPATRERKTIKDAIVERQVAWLFIVLGNACFQFRVGSRSSSRKSRRGTLIDMRAISGLPEAARCT